MHSGKTAKALGTILLCGALGGAFAAPDPARSASSRDYPGPCWNEQVAGSIPTTPLYLSADYHGQNPSTGIINLPEAGRIRLGISCVATGYVVARIGSDSALCTQRGRCTLAQLEGLTEEDVQAVRYIPGEIPFLHICQRHGFGWYDVTNLPEGFYLAVAKSGSGFFGLVDGHGTADTYSFFGNGGAYQPVNCSAFPPPPPPPPGDGDGGGGGGCGGGLAPSGELMPELPCLY